MRLRALLALLLVACTSEANQNFTGDTRPPGFFPGEVVTEQGRLSAGLYDVVFIIAAAIFLLVEGLLILIAIRFRSRKTDTGLPVQDHGNNLLEIAWTLIPAIIVTGLFLGTASVLGRVDEKVEDPGLVVDVTGFQWQWTFEYPGITRANGEPISFTGSGSDGPEMVVPTNERVRIRLKAQDVIHSFYVPQFFYKLDVIPGRINQFDVVVQQPGTYGGQCAEFCGLAHNEMYFTVRAVDRAEFDTWAQDAVQQANATPAPAPSGAESPAPGGTVAVTSVSTLEGFDPANLRAPADTPITFQLTNADPAVPHNVAVKGGNPDGTDWIGLPVAEPGASATYQAPAMAAGDYEFFCSIHPNMRGTLTVGG